MTLPLPPMFQGAHCDVCGTKDDLAVTVALLSDPPIPCEWRCENCIKAVIGAREQRFGSENYYTGIEKKKSKKPKRDKRYKC